MKSAETKKLFNKGYVYKKKINNIEVEISQIEKELSINNINNLWNFVRLVIKNGGGKKFIFDEIIYKDEIQKVHIINKKEKIVSFFWVSGAGSGNYGSCFLIIFEKKTFKTLEIPKESKELLKEVNYFGHDEFDFVGEKIVRKFPIYKDEDPNCCPTGGIVTIHYEFNDEINQLFEKEVIVEKK